MIGRRKNTSSLKIDIIKAFGADLDLEIRDSLFFVSENVQAIAYPVGHHIAIRDLFVREDLRKNDIMFIYNDPEVEKITSMNVSKDNSLLLVCEKKAKTCCISIYKVNKLNFNNLTIFKPKRKVISTIYSEFRYSSFYVDGNYVVSLGVINNENNKPVGLQGVIWDIQIFQPFRDDNYKPKCVFDISLDITKISMENKILCITGQSDLSFYYIYENSIKAFKNPVHNLNIANNNFIDHDWVSGKIPILITITDKNDVYILEGDHEKVNKGIIKDMDEDDSNIRITKFVIRQHISNCFNDFYKNACIVRTFSKGLVIGSLQGHMLFLEKTNHYEHMYKTIRYIAREKPAKVVGLSFDLKEDHLAIAFNSNEICTIDSSNILENLKNENFEGVKFNLVCDGFHSGPITSMDIALQRPIIVTTSQSDKTVRVWNYLTGHCEYCKILLTEKENEDREMDVLAVAIHPNGYYLAVSDREMIRFFHLCYKELRFYNNDVVNNENPKRNCHLLKFSYGGHLLAAVSNKTLYIMRSYTRETLKEIETPHTGTIKNIIFHNQDLYLYTIGSEGMIVEYNLFDFRVEKVSTKHISYTGGTILNLADKTNIISCGAQSATKYMISENSLIDGGEKQNNSTLTQVAEKLLSVCQIRSKKYDILSLAGGTLDGFLHLYPYPLNENYQGQSWEGLKSHRSSITNVLYSRDTNLIFSSGDDGNIFIYCIYELPDGEHITYEDNKTSNMNQLSSILDEGLGDNVLYPLQGIFNYEEQSQNLSNLLLDEKKQKSFLISTHQSNVKEVESKLNKQRETDIKSLDEKLKEMKITKDATVDHYEEKIKQIVNEKNTRLLENEQNFNSRIDQMSNTIHDLTSQIHYLKNNHVIEMNQKDQEYEKKFKDFEFELRKKFEELKSNNDKLLEELHLREKLEELKFVHLDQEHEQEISYKIENYEKLITQEKNIKILNQNEILSLKDQKIKLEQEKFEKENTIKKLSEELERQIFSNQNLKKIIEQKEKDNDDMKKKLKKSEEVMQEKSTLANFSNKLRNELYKKNNEVMSNFNRQQGDITDLKSNNKNIEKELEEAMKLLEIYEKEVAKQKILIDELKLKCYEERQNAKSKENEMDNLLKKIYISFQTNDRKKIFEGISEIYGIYLTSDKRKQIDSVKLNVDIRDELGKQINFLHNTLSNVSDIKKKRENIQINAIHNRTEENSTLINELNKNKMDYINLDKEYKKMKSEYFAMLKKLENYERNDKEKDNSIRKKDSTSSPKLPNLNLSQTNKSNTVEDTFILRNKSGPIFDPKKGKIFKGNMLSKNSKDKESFNPYELLKIIDAKNNIIMKQKNELVIMYQQLDRKPGIQNVLNNDSSVNAMLNNDEAFNYSLNK